MFKYPLAVTIDTNIFDAAKFDLCDASPLKTLENYVKNGKIKVVLSDIVVRESKRHIADQIKKICGIMRKARAAALEESTEHLISTIGLGEILRIVTNKGELISKGEEMFDDFLRTINTEILGADLIDVGLVLGDYFETKPPFENSEKKKSEFPDAFIAQQIRKRFGETEEVVIISNDNRQEYGSSGSLLPETVPPGISAGAWAFLPFPAVSSPHRKARSPVPVVRRLLSFPAHTGRRQNQSHPHPHRSRSSGNADPASCLGFYRDETGSKPSRSDLYGFHNAPQPVLL